MGFFSEQINDALDGTGMYVLAAVIGMFTLLNAVSYFSHGKKTEGKIAMFLAVCVFLFIPLSIFFPMG